MHLNYRITAEEFGTSIQRFAVEGKIVLRVEVWRGSNPVNGEWFDNVLIWK